MWRYRIRTIAYILVVIGGLDLGIFGLLGIDVIYAALGWISIGLLRLAYILIGIAAIVILVPVPGDRMSVEEARSTAAAAQKDDPSGPTEPPPPPPISPEPPV